MKVTIENKKGLSKDLKVFVDKKTIETHMNEKYEEVKKQVSLKGFRPGKVPKEILKRQFGKSIYSEVLDQILKGESPKPGSYRGRVNSEPENNRKTLLDVKNA